jgi:hypothetical protein
MSSNSPETERPRNPTHFGGGGLYDAPSADDEASPMKARLGDHLDSSSRQELLTYRPVGAAPDFARRNRLPLLLAAGGIAMLLVALTRRSLRG